VKWATGWASSSSRGLALPKTLRRSPSPGVSEWCLRTVPPRESYASCGYVASAVLSCACAVRSGPGGLPCGTFWYMYLHTTMLSCSRPMAWGASRSTLVTSAKAARPTLLTPRPRCASEEALPPPSSFLLLLPTLRGTRQIEREDTVGGAATRSLYGGGRRLHLRGCRRTGEEEGGGAEGCCTRRTR
jgi:hypothetical protein